MYNAPESFSATEAVNKENNKSLSTSKWKLLSPVADLSEITDTDDNTFLEVKKKTPLVIDLGEAVLIKGFTYIPFNKVQSSNILRYNFYISLDGKNWAQVKKNAIFNNIANNPVKQDVTLFATKSEKARYIKLEPIETVDSGDNYFVAGIKLF